MDYFYKMGVSQNSCDTPITMSLNSYYFVNKSIIRLLLSMNLVMASTDNG